ncbi:MAG: bacteriohemerythrin [Anaerolineae bacterium]|nr:bacteriohemerythrin [Anaerolineae bacterium]
MAKIRKIQVANGVYWVEIPEAHLYIQCGCPADSVKHLKQRGLIVTREESNVLFETGPNAILLSDLLIQNGSFANLSEFPVLQMLYKQGMIIPNHPNNTGAKPLLLGSKDQVQAQMQYIFRGNYGLISQTELLSTGISQAVAHEMMVLKLKFAFGRIQQTEELLETRMIESDAVEIKNGVFIRRLRLNVFEFRYQDETVTVDLNLSPYTIYNIPYRLDFHNIKREYFAVIHSGQGNGWDSHRPCVSSIVMFQGKIYLVDAGPNFLHSLRALGISVNEIEGLFQTHAHDDHFADLPALMRADHRIRYFATPLVRASVTKKLSALVSIEEEDFANYFEVHDLEFDIWNNIDGLEVMPLLSPHPVETNIFVFRTLWGDRYHTYAHFSDIVSFPILQDMVASSPDAGISQTFYDKVRANYTIPADLKKIDAGGEFIHGNAEDFRNDPSTKIILAHTDSELTDAQKEIGSGAPFGTVDVLIPTYQEYVWHYAHNFLQAYFPSVPLHELRILLNNPVVTFNPETIILRGGMLHTDLYLLLTGNVELIQSEAGVHNLLSAGALVGEISGLTGSPSMATYRAVNFVQALRLPCKLYLEFVKRNGLFINIHTLQDKREFLQKTWLFGEAISYPIQNKLAQAMHVHYCPVGETLSAGTTPGIYILTSGKMQRYIGKDVFETLDVGDFFGEDGVLFGIPSLFQARALEPTEMYQIPGDMLLDIPIVRWKLFETFEKRIGLILDSTLLNIPVFYWRKEYSVNIQEMDRHHRQIFERANRVYAALNVALTAARRAGGEHEILEEAVDFLARYAEYHCTEEEALMKLYRYPDYEIHRKKHERLHQQILEFQEQFKQGEVQEGLDFLEFFKNWFINHILTEDRKYARYLNNKGVF